MSSCCLTTPDMVNRFDLSKVERRVSGRCKNSDFPIARQLHRDLAQVVASDPILIRRTRFRLLKRQHGKKQRWSVILPS
jgi:hypothetical protein